ncbi:hypothetical protein SLS62_010358 [Diatrype stigma]|uniref:Transcription elongation factor Eaf N-terminal domain-containing protein n=1 Tax=Diatrype stigma TaxID=117547 RepID=A0AAN9UCA4_9PEZI
MAAAGLLDPTKAGKYPVILSDALLGKESSEVYTGVRYNHKPNLSSSTAPELARVKPTPSAKKGTSYDLSFLDNGERYTYQGSRRTKDGQYVLIFDSTREVFILHKVDSMFNMNLIRTPTNTDANSLRREYPQLDGGAAAVEDKPTKTQKRGAAAKEKQEKNSLPMPQKKPPAEKPAPPPKKTIPQDDDEESDDDDDFGLTIENPGGEEPGTRSQILRDFSPAFPGRRFSEFVQENEREASEEQGEASEQEEDEGEDIIGDGGDGGTVDGDDADGEDDDDDDRSIEHFKLPSPMRGQMTTQNGGDHQQQQQRNMQTTADDDESDDDEGEQMVDVDGPDDEDDDLEAELMAALEEEHQDQESDVSEEE